MTPEPAATAPPAGPDPAAPAGLVLVLGATGRQGGATARHLLGRGVRVRALTRAPDRPAARRLAAAGAEVVRGNMEDAASLARALEGARGVFSVQNFWEKGVGRAGEVRQGRAVARAARAAGVGHLVQASIAGCDRAPGVAHFASKHEVEQAVDAEGLPRTFLRTVFFMDNVLDPRQGRLVFPLLAGALRPDLGFHLIAVEDIGAFAADAFAHPDRAVGQTLEVAGDRLTVAAMRATYERVTGRRPPRFRLPFLATRLLNAEFARQLAWNNAVGWDVDVAAVRRRRPELLSFAAFLAWSGAPAPAAPPERAAATHEPS